MIHSANRLRHYTWRGPIWKGHADTATAVRIFLAGPGQGTAQSRSNCEWVTPSGERWSQATNLIVGCQHWLSSVAGSSAVPATATDCLLAIQIWAMNSPFDPATASLATQMNTDISARTPVGTGGKMLGARNFSAPFGGCDTIPLDDTLEPETYLYCVVYYKQMVGYQGGWLANLYTRLETLME